MDALLIQSRDDLSGSTSDRAIADRSAIADSLALPNRGVPTPTPAIAAPFPNRHPASLHSAAVETGVIAVSYDALLAIVRQRLIELDTTHAAVDHLAGLHDGYFSKIATQAKQMGVGSLMPVLGALGLRLRVEVDPEAAPVVARLAKRRLKRSLAPHWRRRRRKASC